MPAAASERSDVFAVEGVVVNAPVRGSAWGNFPPELALNADEIGAYGVSSVSELTEALAPLTRTGRGDDGLPVLLLNGSRISSFAEVRDLPIEAILRVEILPEAVALNYGYKVDQKVLNVVLRPSFRAAVAEAGLRATTGGGGEKADALANLIQIQQPSRVQLDISASRQSPVLESDRDLEPRADARFRTLAPRSETVTVNGVVARSLPRGVAATITGGVELTNSQVRLGTNSGEVPRALEGQSDGLDGQAGLVVNGAVRGWGWSASANTRHTTSARTTERRERGVGFTDKADVRARSAEAQVVVYGKLAQLPAGPVSATVAGELQAREIDTQSFRSGVFRAGGLSRQVARVQGSVDIPLASGKSDAVPFLGQLSVNLNMAREQVSRLGVLNSVGAGLDWAPVQKVRIAASYNFEPNAPTVSQLGNPESVTPGVWVYDFRNAQAVEVLRIEGGNPRLSPSDRKVLKLGLTWKPWTRTDISVSASYVGSRSTDIIAGLSTATTQLEPDYPERFIRDAGGTLVQFDSRPVNYHSRVTDELRWGFNYQTAGRRAGRPADGTERNSAGAAPSRTAGSAEAAATADNARSAGGASANSGRLRGARLQLSVFHTFRLRDQIVVSAGGPVLDVLDGLGGGGSRQQIDLQANLSKQGLGASLRARWQSGATVRGYGAPGSDDLVFADLATVSLRLWADLGQQRFARGNPWLRGSRAALSIDNLFDDAQEVRTASGTTPFNYQPDVLDPLGRTVRLSLRRPFF